MLAFSLPLACVEFAFSLLLACSLLAFSLPFAFFQLAFSLPVFSSERIPLIGVALGSLKFHHGAVGSFGVGGFSWDSLFFHFCFCCRFWSTSRAPAFAGGLPSALGTTESPRVKINIFKYNRSGS